MSIIVHLLSIGLQTRTCRSETPPFCLRKNVLSLKHPAGVFVASANANLSGRSPSILLSQDRSVACKPHWGFHCFTSFRKRELVGARPLHLADARPFCRLHTPLGCALLNFIQQTRTCRSETPPSCAVRKTVPYSLFYIAVQTYK